MTHPTGPFQGQIQFIKLTQYDVRFIITPLNDSSAIPSRFPQMKRVLDFKIKKKYYFEYNLLKIFYLFK